MVLAPAAAARRGSRAASLCPQPELTEMPGTKGIKEVGRVEREGF